MSFLLPGFSVYFETDIFDGTAGIVVFRPSHFFSGLDSGF